MLPENMNIGGNVETLNCYDVLYCVVFACIGIHQELDKVTFYVLDNYNLILAFCSLLSPSRGCIDCHPYMTSGSDVGEGLTLL